MKPQATPTYDGDEHGGNTRQETVNDKGIVFFYKVSPCPLFLFQHGQNQHHYTTCRTPQVSTEGKQALSATTKINAVLSGLFPPHTEILSW